MKLKTFEGVSLKGVYEHSWKQFFNDLKSEIDNDNVFNGAAALAYYFMLAIFPAMLFMLSLIPYLPIPNLDKEIMGMLRDVLPGDAAGMFTKTIDEVVHREKQGLLSIGAFLTLWAASSGLYAIMQQLNITYKVKEARPFWKVRGTAVLLTIGFGAMIVIAFGSILLGDQVYNWLRDSAGLSGPLLALFSMTRVLVILTSLALAFSFTYYFGPDVKQKFLFVTPGSLIGMILFALASLAFKGYVENFGNYDATYGSIGAIIVLMLWLNILGLVILLGSEVNALVEHYSPAGKDKGEQAGHTNGAPPVAPKSDGQGSDIPSIQANRSSPQAYAKYGESSYLSSTNTKGVFMEQMNGFPSAGSTEVRTESRSYGSVISELTDSLKGIVKGEMDLIRSEVSAAAPNIGKHSAQVAGFAALLVLSAFPLLAFLVIGLGEILNGNYWLSSLIVGLVCAGVGGFFALRAYKQIKDQDLKFPASQESLRRVTHVVSEKVKEVQEVAKRRIV